MKIMICPYIITEFNFVSYKVHPHPQTQTVKSTQHTSISGSVIVYIYKPHYLAFICCHTYEIQARYIITLISPLHNV